jgi:SsrA-binding protein
MSQDNAKTPRIMCQNRKAHHEYHIDETFEAGLVLTGTEIKSLRTGRGSLQEAYANIKGDEAWIFQFHIPPYEQGNIFNVDPVRPRKLLLHKREIGKLAGAIARKGYTLVPLDVHMSHGRAKLSLGLARGKKLYDKREDMKQRDTKRDMERAIKGGRE